MVRSETGSLTRPASDLRQDLTTIIRAAIVAADAGLLVQHALSDREIIASLHGAGAVDVIAAGKAAGPMLAALAAATSVPLRRLLGVGPKRPAALPHHAEWIDGGHPVPTDGSVAAARHALRIARSAGAHDLLVVLLSGGASSMMALPARDLSFSDKQETIRRLLDAGADIYELNTVRKHLSAIKGGQLAAAHPGPTLSLIVSDVVGDDLSVIASGPTVADASTFRMAMQVLDRRGGRGAYPATVTALLQRGMDGVVVETPKPGDQRLTRSAARVIGGSRAALDGARAAAESLGYYVQILDEPVVGEARVAARTHVTHVGRIAPSLPRPLCVLSAGETTVRVVGQGRGGRNQEFALSMAHPLGAVGARVAAASVGTDGIDGPTDAAGAMVDNTTMSRAQAAGLDEPARYLDDNNSYAFFAALDDLICTGATNTNVGDLQVVLIDG